MKTNHLAKAMALLAFSAATTTAHAALLPLQDAIVTATYNGAAAGMLGLDAGFATGAGANTTALDPTNIGVEFLTADFLFGVDVGADGPVTVIANSAIPTGAYSMRFDFGSSLANPITAFTFTGSSGAAGVPGLAVIDGHTIAIDLGSVTWSEYGTVTAEISAAAVPEPSTVALLVAGLAGIGCLRRTRR